MKRRWTGPGCNPAVGAIIGGFVVGLIVPVDLIRGINITTIIVTTLGAILLLAIYRWFVGRRAARV